MLQGENTIQGKINQVDARINTKIIQGNRLKEVLEGIQNDLIRHLKEDSHLLTKKIQKDLETVIAKLETKIEQLSSN